jgi:predicted aspartyl protease
MLGEGAMHRGLHGLLFGGALAFSTVAFCTATALAECPATPLATLPLTRNDVSQYTVPVQINGHPFNLAVDTGSPKTILTERAATAAGLERKSAGGMHLTMPSGAVASGKAVGEFIIANFKVDAQEFPVIPDKGTYGTKDGLLGADILSHFAVEFDFARSVMSLYSQSGCGAVPWAYTGEVHSVDFHIEAGHAVFDADLDGKRYNAHLDTGAPRAYIELETAKDRFGFDENDATQLRRRDGTHPEHPSYYHTFDTITAGTLTVNKAELLLVSKEVSIVRMKQPWMSFGLTLLKKYRVFVAYDEKKVYFTDAEAVK